MVSGLPGRLSRVVYTSAEQGSQNEREPALIQHPVMEGKHVLETPRKHKHVPEVVQVSIVLEQSFPSIGFVVVWESIRIVY
jgi:hypothetical protein